jgi:aminoglycoside phosphotransferase (APT) family kinase protein
MANGWDNLMCRLGAELIIRLPRRAVAADLIRHEQRWLPELAPRLPLAVPAPVRIGRATADYPWPWSIVPFLPGRPAASSPPADPAAAAIVLARFLRALHVPAAADAPANPVRGVPLASRSETVTARMAQVADLVDVAAIRPLWQESVAAPPWAGPPAWLHGDLHPANILVDGGQVSAVVDFGDITAGDPATDLAVAWMMLPASCHDAFRDSYGTPDDPLWMRARGWALALALAYLGSSADNPLMAQIGRRTIAALTS